MKIATGGGKIKIGVAGMGNLKVSNNKNVGNYFIDPRDGTRYKTVQIGNQIWMAENLAYDNGCSGKTWIDSTDVGWCGYHTSDTQQQNGLLYQWSAAMNNSTTEGAQGICPAGWHLPTDEEWHTLESYLATGTCDASRSGGGCEPAGTALKSGGSSGWNGLLNGYFWSGTFYDFGTLGIWWSSSQAGGNAWRRLLGSSVTVNRNANNQGNGFSVRCLKD